MELFINIMQSKVRNPSFLLRMSYFFRCSGLCHKQTN
jgi:hypothetical protein